MENLERLFWIPMQPLHWDPSYTPIRGEPRSIRKIPAGANVFFPVFLRKIKGRNKPKKRK